MRMRCTVYLSLRPSSHEIWALPDNTANFFWPIGDRINGVPLYYNHYYYSYYIIIIIVIIPIIIIIIIIIITHDPPDAVEVALTTELWATYMASRFWGSHRSSHLASTLD